MLVCDYGKRTRPKVPFPYFEEAWTGIEYLVAALFLNWGMVREGLEVIENVRWRAEQARQEQLKNPRYRWLGELPRKAARRLMASCRALALTSKMEGGANVISEATVDGVPVIASRIDGSLGLLGADHPAFFPVGDSEALASLMWRFEQDAAFYQQQKTRCVQSQSLFRPERELAAWRRLIEEVTG